MVRAFKQSVFRALLVGSTLLAIPQGLAWGASAPRCPSSPPEFPGPGGYSNQDVRSSEIQEAAQHAVALLRDRTQTPRLYLAGVQWAQAQVVAGMNYRMALDLETHRGRRCAVIVLYKDLEGSYSLSSVTVFW